MGQNIWKKAIIYMSYSERDMLYRYIHTYFKFVPHRETITNVCNKQWEGQRERECVLLVIFSNWKISSSVLSFMFFSESMWLLLYALLPWTWDVRLNSGLHSNWRSKMNKLRSFSGHQLAVVTSHPKGVNRNLRPYK